MLAGLALEQLALIWLVVVFAAVMRAFTGFGFALAAVPVFAVFLPPSEAVVLSVSLTLAVSLITLRSYWGQFPLRPLLPMLLLSVAGTALGAALLSAISTQQFRLFTGLSVMAACAVLSAYRPAPQPPRAGLAALVGGVSGLMNGAFAMPGPPVIVYAMATEATPVRSRALLMTFFLCSAVIGLCSYGAAGFINARAPWLFLAALPAMLLGDKLGYFLFHRFGDRLYRRVALVVLFAVGVSTMLGAMV